MPRRPTSRKSSGRRVRKLTLESLEVRRVMTGLPEFVSDIDPTFDNGYAQNFTTVGSNGYFLSQSATRGLELWQTNGAASGTHRVVDPQTQMGFGADSLLSANNNLFFDGPGGLFSYDGTGSPSLIYPSNWSHPLYTFTGVSTGSYAAFTFSSENGLLLTNGRADENIQLSMKMALHNGRVQVASVGDTIYFVAITENGSELWKTQEFGPTQLVKDIAVGPSSSDPYNLVNLNGTLFFVANDRVKGPALWKSDGTAAGTVIVKDIVPSAATGFLTDLTVVGNKLFFQADDGVHGTELWVSDGTSGGTAMVADIAPGQVGSIALKQQWSETKQFVGLGNFAYFVANDGTHGAELWRSDGTAQNTTRLTDFAPTTNNDPPDGLIAGSNTVYFHSPIGELWRTNGAITEPVQYSSGAIAKGYSYQFVGGSLVFNATPGLWKTGGIGAETQYISELKGDGASPEHLTDVNGTIYFDAHNTQYGVSLFKSDGTATGTVPASDSLPGQTASLSTQLLEHHGKLLSFSHIFVSEQTFLLSIDGTSHDTSILAGFAPGKYNYEIDEISVGKYAYFSFTTDDGDEIWRTDGTAAGTLKLKQFYRGNQLSGNLTFTELNGKVYFGSQTNSDHNELWTSDGTVEGTVQVASLSPRPLYERVLSLATYNGYIYIQDGTDLYKSDGTQENTTLVTALGIDVTRTGLTATNSYLYYWSASGNKMALWRTDGTPDGTIALAESTPAFEIYGRNNGVFNDLLYFTSMDSEHGEELWRSDGSPEGTYLVQDIAIPGSSSPRDYVVSKNMLYFSAADDVHGRGLWRLGLSADPTITSTAHSSFRENAPPVRIAPAAVVTDPDSANFATGKLTVSLGSGSDSSDRLLILPGGDLAVSGNQLHFKGIVIGTFSGGTFGDPLVVTFNEKASLFRVQAVMRSLAFSNASESPSPTLRQVSIELSDGDGGTSTPLAVTINVTPVNDAPRLSSTYSAALVSIDEDNRNSYGTPVWTLLSGSSDVDAAAARGVALTANATGKGVWQFTLDGGQSWQPLGMVSSIAARLLPANGNLSRLRFVPNQDFNGVVYLGFAAWDQTQGTAGDMRDVSTASTRGGTTAFSVNNEIASLAVAPVNDAPVVTVPTSSVGYARQSPAVLVASTATVRDIDTVNYAGGWFQVQIKTGVDTNDLLSIGGAFKVVDGNVIFNNSVSIGTVRTGVSAGRGQITIDLNSEATPYRVEQLVRSIKFSTSLSAKTGQRTIGFSLNDGNTTSKTATMSVLVS